MTATRTDCAHPTSPHNLNTIGRELIDDLAPHGRVQQHLAERVARMAERLEFCDAFSDALVAAMFSGAAPASDEVDQIEAAATAAGVPLENVREMMTAATGPVAIGKILTQVDRVMRMAQRAYDQALVAWHREKERVTRRAMLDDRRDRIEREAAARAARKTTPATAATAPPTKIDDAPASTPVSDEPPRKRAERPTGVKRPLPVGDELLQLIRDTPLPESIAQRTTS
ncbi:MAG: hypothetical protein AB7S36_23845 [Planctomycetota bacterium]